MSFLTVEDVNSVIYSNQSCYWCEIDFSKISTTVDYTDVNYDCFKVSCEVGFNGYEFSVEMPSNWTLGWYMKNDTPSNPSFEDNNFKVLPTPL